MKPPTDWAETWFLLPLQLAAVDKTVDALDLSMLRLEDNIRDKESTLLLEEKVALLDGRINLNQPPPSSIATVSVLRQTF